MALTVKICNKIKEKDTTKSGSAIQPGTFFLGRFTPEKNDNYPERLFVKTSDRIYPLDLKQQPGKTLFDNAYHWSVLSTVYSYTPVDVLLTASSRKGKPKKKKKEPETVEAGSISITESVIDDPVNNKELELVW